MVTIKTATSLLKDTSLLLEEAWPTLKLLLVSTYLGAMAAIFSKFIYCLYNAYISDMVMNIVIPCQFRGIVVGTRINKSNTRGKREC
jgi:hypothetical protein